MKISEKHDCWLIPASIIGGFLIILIVAPMAARCLELWWDYWLK